MKKEHSGQRGEPTADYPPSAHCFLGSYLQFFSVPGTWQLLILSQEPADPLIWHFLKPLFPADSAQTACPSSSCLPGPHPHPHPTYEMDKDNKSCFTSRWWLIAKLIKEAVITLRFQRKERCLGQEWVVSLGLPEEVGLEDRRDLKRHEEKASNIFKQWTLQP